MQMHTFLIRLYRIIMYSYKLVRDDIAAVFRYETYFLLSFRSCDRVYIFVCIMCTWAVEVFCA